MSITAKVGIYILALSCMISPALVALAQLLLLIVILINFRKILQEIAQDFYGKFLLFFLIMLGVSFSIGYAQYGLFDNQLEQALDYLKISLFGITGWIMYRYLPDMKPILMVYIFSVLLAIVYIFFSGDVLNKLDTPGFRFTLNKTIHPIQSAMYMSIAILGLMLMFMHVLQDGKKWRLIPLLVVSAFFSYFVILTQSRGPVLGLMLAMIVMVVLVFSMKSEVTQKLNLKPFITGFILIVLLIGLVLGNDNMRHRLTSETDVYSSLVKGDLENIKYNSAGARIHMWKFALDTIAERPLLGHGPYIKHLIDASQLKVKFGHIHNLYLEIAMRYGVAGLLLFLSMIIWLLYRLFIYWQAKRDDSAKYQFIFYCCSVIIVAVWGLTDYRLTHWENTAFLWLLLGGAYSQILRNQRQHDCNTEQT